MRSFFCLILFLFGISLTVFAGPGPEAQLREYRRLDSLYFETGYKDAGLGITYSQQMLEIGRQTGIDTLILQAGHHLGQSLEMIAQFDNALKTYYDVLLQAEKSHNCYYEYAAATSIGSVHQTMKNPEKSLEFLFRAKNAAMRCGNYNDTIVINYEIGFCMAETGIVEKGIAIVESNLKTAKKIGLGDAILFGIDNLSNLLAENGQPQKALDYQLELLEMPDLWPEDEAKAQVYEHLSEIYVRLKDWDNAQRYQTLALRYSLEQEMNDWIYECYKLQALIDEGRGNYKSALENHKLYMALRDSVYASEYEGKMAALTALYDLESKQRTIISLEKDQQIKAGQIKEQRTLMLTGLLAVILIILLIRFRNQQKTRKMQEAFAQDLIAAQENERQRISRELHDSVGQNILFIKNKLQRLNSEPDKQLITSVDAALEEVRNIAKDLYPNQLEVYGLPSAVESLCEIAQESSGLFISSDMQHIDEKLNREAKINCYRIIQECINNATKHAGATAVRITSSQRPGGVEVVVQDNGRGFDKTQLQRRAGQSFGLINMEERIKMLRGKFDLETAVNKGVKITFTIPSLS